MPQKLMGSHGSRSSVYKIAADAPVPAKIAQSKRMRETPAKKSMGIKVHNPVTKGDKSTGGNHYESGRMDKSRS